MSEFVPVRHAEEFEAIDQKLSLLQAGVDELVEQMFDLAMDEGHHVRAGEILVAGGHSLSEFRRIAREIKKLIPSHEVTAPE